MTYAVRLWALVGFEPCAKLFAAEWLAFVCIMEVDYFSVPFELKKFMLA